VLHRGVVVRFHENLGGILPVRDLDSLAPHTVGGANPKYDLVA
jgi:hypothetical protein